jgi:hypothetical protein
VCYNVQTFEQELILEPEEQIMAKVEHTREAIVTRTLRAAIKVGDDYYTIEETIQLPADANDDEITQAVTTGLRMYEAQRAAVEDQVRAMRDHVVAQPLPVQIKDPDAPASEKQRSYMDYLLKELHWDNDRLHAFAAERSLNVLTLTKREASELIDDLKHLLTGTTGGNGSSAPAQDDAREDDDAQPVASSQQAILPIGERATQRQIRALERLAGERGIDLQGELDQRFGGRSLDELSMDEAGQLLSEWQQRPRQLRVVRKAA